MPDEDTAYSGWGDHGLCEMHEPKGLGVGIVERLRRNTVSECMSAAPEAADEIVRLRKLLNSEYENKLNFFNVLNQYWPGTVDELLEDHSRLKSALRSLSAQIGQTGSTETDMATVIPKAEVLELTDERLRMALKSLTEIQYFRECEHKHRAWAWDAMNALAPELARLSADNPQAAFYLVRDEASNADMRGCATTEPNNEARKI